jgi:hypothetical protein
MVRECTLILYPHNLAHNKNNASIALTQFRLREVTLPKYTTEILELFGAEDLEYSQYSIIYVKICRAIK